MKPVKDAGLMTRADSTVPWAANICSSALSVTP
jgi:hypothetical protein